GLKRAKRSEANTELPSDFDILSPPTLSRPECIQMFAKASPAARDWASSFSWWGKRRSSPPPWMSKFAPRYFVDMAEHSMCQPGRPRPHGEGQEAVIGSSGLCAFHSAKSRASF